MRVFTTLSFCPYHRKHTIPELPFDVEEHIATKDLNPRTGRKGSLGGYLDCASRIVGQGAEWALQEYNFGCELKLTIRQLRQKSEQKDENGPKIWLNKFEVDQEQTSYCKFYLCIYFVPFTWSSLTNQCSHRDWPRTAIPMPDSSQKSLLELSAVWQSYQIFHKR